MYRKQSSFKESPKSINWVNMQMSERKRYEKAEERREEVILMKELGKEQDERILRDVLNEEKRKMRQRLQNINELERDLHRRKERNREEK